MSTSAGAGEPAANFFPLTTIADALKLFKAQLEQPDPSLALLSIVAGALEHQWTQAKEKTVLCQPVASSDEATRAESHSPSLLKIDPPLEWQLIEALVAKFESIIKSYCDTNLLQNALNNPGDVRALIKHVADIVWNTLSKSHYKDRPHLQSIYSYLTGSKLDCFGVALAVVAACQVLDLPEVHLALSEDHAWVVFGKDGTETAEVTWHGKGNEDKRGQPVDIEKAKTSWLYLAGQPVVCDRHMEVAAVVSSMNPAITANMDSIECGVLQQELLWLLYDMGHLKQYPLALGNLGDLEEISPTLGRPPCHALFNEAVQVSQRVYANHHVYPYTYQGGYSYRVKEYKKALQSWSEAANVMKVYRYSKDDEEIYKEFMEIANELIPHLVKSASLNAKTYNQVLKDPECFSYLLKFYDGICCWEEGSATPVLHIGWAKAMVSSCSKFEGQVRKKVEIPTEKDEEEDDEDDDDDDDSKGSANEQVPDMVADEEEEESSSVELINNNYKKVQSNLSTGDQVECDTTDKLSESSVSCDGDHDDPELVAYVSPELMNQLSEGCKDRVLNVDFLLGKTRHSPFLGPDSPAAQGLLANPHKYLRRFHSRLLPSGKTKPDLSNNTSPFVSDRPKVALTLHSAKMRGLKSLLSTDKLNTSAIQLQLTAQSQTRKSSGLDTTGGVGVAGGGLGGVGGGAGLVAETGRPKRARRE